MRSSLLECLKQRLADRPDSEHVQIVIRLVLVVATSLYFLAERFWTDSANSEAVEMVQWVSACALAISAALGAALLISPGVSITRRIIGLLHDVSAVSIALYLGEGAVAGLAVVYLWASLGNGFRFGNAYLYGTAIVSVGAFLVVVAVSPFWREQMTLSLMMLAVITLIPPYVAPLLRSLREAKEQLQRQATIDLLTGLLNRTESEFAIERQLDKCMDGHVLLFCDLDLFKLVNDSAGHAAGDKLLADIAAIISSCTSDRDITGRLGGDEFCILLVDSTIERARQVAEEVRNRVSAYRLAWGADRYSVGISIGVAPTSAVPDMASLFRLADAACYAAKNAGRNQVHVVDPRTGIEDTQRIRRLFAENVRVTTHQTAPLVAEKA